MEASGKLYPRYPLDWRLDDPQSQSESGGEEEKSYHGPFRALNSGRPAYRTLFLYWLS